MKKLINFNCDEKLKQEAVKRIKNSNGKYKDLTQFIILAIQEKLSGEKQ